MGKVIADLAASAASATFSVENATSSVNYVLSKTDGSAGEFLKTDGSGALSFASAAGGFHRVVVKTASDATYSPDTGVTKIVVEGVGGGGGGGLPPRNRSRKITSVTDSEPSSLTSALSLQAMSTPP